MFLDSRALSLQKLTHNLVAVAVAEAELAASLPVFEATLFCLFRRPRRASEAESRSNELKPQRKNRH